MSNEEKVSWITKKISRNVKTRVTVSCYLILEKITEKSLFNCMRCFFFRLFIVKTNGRRQSWNWIIHMNLVFLRLKRLIIIIFLWNEVSTSFLRHLIQSLEDRFYMNIKVFSVWLFKEHFSQKYLTNNF